MRAKSWDLPSLSYKGVACRTKSPSREVSGLESPILNQICARHATAKRDTRRKSADPNNTTTEVPHDYIPPRFQASSPLSAEMAIAPTKVATAQLNLWDMGHPSRFPAQRGFSWGTWLRIIMRLIDKRAFNFWSQDPAQDSGSHLVEIRWIEGAKETVTAGPPPIPGMGVCTGPDFKKEIQKLDFFGISLFSVSSRLPRSNYETKDKYLIANCEENGYYLHGHILKP
jgi:hypothetical protein